MREEPDYPWIWLQAAKLRSYFGNREGALEAVQTGLRLVPDDHEFLTLHEEILAGASLEEMEYHWIDPEADRKLQQGLDMDADSKLRAISCITTNQEGLAAFCELFSVGPEDWLGTAPYCRIRCSALEFPVELVFRMNQAGLSKLGIDWLRTEGAARKRTLDLSKHGGRGSRRTRHRVGGPRLQRQPDLPAHR